jgi:hypothetical protein
VADQPGRVAVFYEYATHSLNQRIREPSITILGINLCRVETLVLISLSWQQEPE